MGTFKKTIVGKAFKYSLLSVILFAAVFMSLPGNYFIHRALIYQLPKIDHYKIFDNRIVRAGSPKPWSFSENYNKKDFPAKYLNEFDSLETVAFLVVQNNKIVFEKYAGDYNASSYSNSFSMAKCILSLLVGAAIDDGYIKSVDQPVSHFLPEWTAFGKDTLTLKHLLTMSAGVDWDESYSSLFSKTTRAYYGNDLWKLTLTQKLIAKPGEKFNYQSGVSLMIAYLLQKATGKTVSAYMSEKLWTPLSAEFDALWSLDKKDGMEKAYCCFNTNARDYARLGQLVLQKGSWNGKQLIDSNYIKEAVTPANWLTHTPKPGKNGEIYQPRPNNFYGYQFWIARYHDMNIPYFRGILGQYIFVIPEMNAVIVRLGQKRSTDFNVDQNHTTDVETWINAGIEILK